MKDPKTAYIEELNKEFEKALIAIARLEQKLSGWRWSAQEFQEIADKALALKHGMDIKQILHKVCVKFFYPNGYWAGFARFFEPHLPGRIGDELLIRVAQVLKINNLPIGLKDPPESIPEQLLIDLLSHSHMKHAREGDVMCHPTADAVKAVALLKARCVFHYPVEFVLDNGPELEIVPL